MGLLLNNYCYWFFFLCLFLHVFRHFLAFPLLCWEKTTLQNVQYRKVQKPSADERPLNSRLPLFSPTTLSANCCWHFAHVVVSIKNVLMHCFLLFLHKKGTWFGKAILSEHLDILTVLLWQCSAVSWIQQILLILAWRVKVNCHRLGCQQVKKKKKKDS